MTKLFQTDEGRIRQLVVRGLSADEIAAEIGVSNRTVRRRIASLGLRLKNRDWTEEDDARLQSLYARRVHLEQIAATLGRSPDAVATRAHRLGFHRAAVRRPREGVSWSGLTDQEAARLLECCKAGMPWRDVANLLGRSVSAVRSAARHRGWDEFSIAARGTYTRRDRADRDHRGRLLSYANRSLTRDPLEMSPEEEAEEARLEALEYPPLEEIWSRAAEIRAARQRNAG